MKKYYDFNALRSLLQVLRRPRARRLLGSLLFVVCVAGLMGVVATCGEQYALLLSVKGSKKAATFTLQVKNLETGAIVLNRTDEKVDPNNPERDISQPGQELRLAVEFNGPGRYLVYLLAQDGAGQNRQFFIKDYAITSVHEAAALLQPMVRDADGDGFPACGTVLPLDPGCQTMNCAHLDCDDNNKSIHPFAQEICGDGKDNDCSAGCGAKPPAGDAVCVDQDKDGESQRTDCDDSDPCRSHLLMEAKNFCTKCGGADKATFPALSRACLDKLAREGKNWTAPYCGDGVDQDCSGKDLACVTDSDCDCFSPPADCNDNDASINPNAREICGDKKDNNCNGQVDEGCFPCDVDGDNHTTPNNTDVNCQAMKKDDTDDYDSGIHSDTTSDTGGSEGGTVKGALREFCSYAKAKNDTAAAPQRHRDVDHDGDKLPASKDGCPAQNCDGDGDGFIKAQCNPPKSRLDCDDTKPHVFPGAPDKCGDGIAQNCVSDRKCNNVTDQDKDGYAPPLDCNDNNAKIHPWAVEICDRVDNDCDGLTDEFNPDHLGQLIATYRPLCNDDNDGICAPDCKPGVDANCSAGGNELSGKCVCSPHVPTGSRDQLDRVKCSGENLNGPASQRCFGAKQRQKYERCDTRDHDCDGRNDDPKGVNLQEAQTKKPCSVSNTEKWHNSPSCKPGVVIGCDLTKTIPNASFIESALKAVSKDFNKHWICSGQSWPVPEVCNGKDDDCNGTMLPKEIDGDKDGYLACSVKAGNDCPKGTKRTDLASKLTGCGDCRDGIYRINPGAQEVCNNEDDNCVAGITDDGKDECPAKGMDCCSTQKTCRDLLTDKDNCGKCGTRCVNSNPALRDADRCVGGKCSCGSSGSTCTGGLNCVTGGVCRCIAGGLCNGCCDGQTLCRVLGSQPTNSCGKAGAACKDCSDGNVCTTDRCLATGDCRSTAVPNSSSLSCPGGKCYNGQCCTGCIGGGACQSGTTTSLCGKDGDPCGTCSITNQCKTPSCSTGVCRISNKPNTTLCNDGLYCTVNDKCTDGTCGGSSRVCPSNDCNNGVCNESRNRCDLVPKSGNPSCTDSGKSGICYGGACCTGCYRLGCQPGTSTSNCGTGGAACVTCTNTNPCTYPLCDSSGTCRTPNRTNLSTCPGGRCVVGVCCTGCISSGPTCRAGTSTTYCGNSGANCSTCSTSNVCRTADCSTGTCLTPPKSNGTSCTASGLSGTCQSGSCCTGCVQSGTCEPGTANDRCGKDGGGCSNCGSSATCQSGTCVATPDAGVAGG
jgi:hypothetical protein